MGSRVFVAGLGAITAIGNNVSECYKSLEGTKTGIGDILFLDTIHKGRIPSGEVKMNNQELGVMGGISGDFSRTILLSLIAANEAFSDSGISKSKSLRVGLVSANTVGGMDKTEDFYPDFLKDFRKGKLRYVFDHECGSISEMVADRLGIRRFITTMSTACSSSANAIAYAARLIKDDLLDVVISGGVDSLTRYTLNGFNSLMILDRGLCRPFDDDRQGLNLGEGSAYIVLVSEAVAKNSAHTPYCELKGYNNSNDAFHPTASSSDGTGPYLAMKGSLERSGLQPQDIDYINLHGTGTANNDSAEAKAILKLFGPNYPPSSSTKTYTGHTLGACGAIEAVFSILAIKYGVVYPNLRFQTPMKEIPFLPVNEFLVNKGINNAMTNSFGFGGNCTSLIFSKY